MTNTTRAQMAAEIAAITTPAEQYAALIDYNGTIQNMALRRMSAEQLEALRAYAATQPPQPFSTVNYIESLVMRAQRSAR